MLHYWPRFAQRGVLAMMHDHDLDRLAAALRAGTLGPAEQHLWADRIDAARSAARRDRDAEAQHILHLWRQRHHSWRSINDAAEKIAADLARYDASSWLIDRCEPKCPERYKGKPHECAWGFLNAHGLPLGARRIRQLLG